MDVRLLTLAVVLALASAGCAPRCHAVTVPITFIDGTVGVAQLTVCRTGTPT